MPLFKQDAGFFRLINDEYINNIHDIRVGYWKIHPKYSSTNIYGESEERAYYNPIWVPTWVNRDDYSFTDDKGLYDKEQTATFSFLLDTMIDLGLVPEPGDIIEYNQQFYEINSTARNKFIGDSNPHRTESSDKPGYNVSIECQTHWTNKDVTGIEDFRPGISND